MTERVTTEIRDGVADVRLSRPDKMNALDGATFDALIAAAEGLSANPDVRAVVLSGEGRAFCAGIDISQMGGGPTIDILPATRFPGGANLPQQAAMVWRRVKVPVIAAVHGVAFGGGLQIALGADMRFVHPEAKLSFMEMRWGLIPDMGGLALGRHVLRDDQMRDLVYTGRTIDGREALSIGLATRLCDDPHAAALEAATMIAGHSPSAMAAAKRVLTLATDASDEAVLLAESEEQARLIGGADQKRAIERNMARARAR